MKKYIFRLAALLLAFTLLLTSCGRSAADSLESSAGDSDGSSASALVGSPAAEAVTMKLARTEGTVGVSDDDGKNVTPAENLGLYSGYGVITERDGYAWINLDSVKLTKMDASSEIEITRDDKKLELYVLSGSLFFNITEPLADDETLNIRTSNMIVGIRGTCGWVEVPDETHMNLYLLEGTVECAAGDNTVTVSAGEMAAMSADGEIEVASFSASAVPAFVQEELEEDDELLEAIPDGSGIDAAEDLPVAYREALAKINGEILYTEQIDFDVDGSPELLVFYLREGSEGTTELVMGVYQGGPEKASNISTWVTNLSDEEDWRVSLAEFDGRLFLYRRFMTIPDPGYPEYYRCVEYYSTIVTDEQGVHFDCVDQIFHDLRGDDSSTTYAQGGLPTYARGNYNIEITAAEYEAARALYSRRQSICSIENGEVTFVSPDSPDFPDLP